MTHPTTVPAQVAGQDLSVKVWHVATLWVDRGNFFHLGAGGRVTNSYFSIIIISFVLSPLPTTNNQQHETHEHSFRKALQSYAYHQPNVHNDLFIIIIIICVASVTLLGMHSKI